MQPNSGLWLCWCVLLLYTISEPQLTVYFYKTTGVIHQVVYGLLLLNTDLHVADQDRRMTRPQFVNNVMSSIRTDLETTQAQSQSNPVLPSTLQHRQSTPRSSVADLPGEDEASSRASEDVFYEAGGPDASSSASVNVDQRGSISVPRESVDSTPVSPPSLLSNPSSTGTIGTVSPGPGSTVSSVMIHTPNASIATDLAGLRKGSIGGSGSISRAWNNEMESALKVRSLPALSSSSPHPLTSLAVSSGSLHVGQVAPDYSAHGRGDVQRSQTVHVPLALFPLERHPSEKFPLALVFHDQRQQAQQHPVRCLRSFARLYRSVDRP